MKPTVPGKPVNTSPESVFLQYAVGNLHGIGQSASITVAVQQERIVNGIHASGSIAHRI